MWRRIAAALDELEIGSDAILLGNGFGGTIALALVLAYPERFADLFSAMWRRDFPKPASRRSG